MKVSIKSNMPYTSYSEHVASLRINSAKNIIIFEQARPFAVLSVRSLRKFLKGRYNGDIRI